jgi:hypothetical protein
MPRGPFSDVRQDNDASYVIGKQTSDVNGVHIYNDHVGENKELRVESAQDGSDAHLSVKRSSISDANTHATLRILNRAGTTEWQVGGRGADDNFKISYSADGVTFSDLFSMTSAGVITTVAGALQAASLPTNLKTGFIPLDLCALREIVNNDIGNVADGAAWGSGGVLAQDTTPKLERTDDATDKMLRVHWAAGNVDEVQFPPIPIPPDFDNSGNMTVHLLVHKGSNTNTTFAIDVQAFSGKGDTEMGGKTGAITATTTPTEYPVTLTGANVGAHPGVLNLSLVPDAHANDAVYLLAAWIEYQRKS